jgi:hypothetical protein
VLLLLVSFSACSSNEPLTASDVVNSFKEAGFPIDNAIVYDEETDVNNLLGRPGEYTSKVNFADARAEQYDDTDPIGGTVEVSENKKDMQRRYEYIKSLAEESPLLGGQYLFPSSDGLILLRIDYDLTSEEADQYNAALEELSTEGTVTPVSISVENMEEASADEAEADSGEIENAITYTAEPTESGELVVIINNGSDVTIPDLEMTVTFYDADGNMLSAESDGHDAILPGAKVVSMVYLPTDSEYNFVEFDHYDIDFDADMDYTLYTNLSGDLSVQDNQGSNGVVAEFENGSDKTIDELEVVAVYYAGDKIVGANMQEEYDIAAGDSVTMEFNLPMDSLYNTIDFDKYTLFVNQAHNFE